MWLRASVNRTNWLKRAGLIAVTLLFIINIPFVTASSYVTVNAVTAADNVLGNRQSCYAGGGHFVFYYNGTALVREFSSDGLTWSGSVEKIFQTGAYYDIVCRTDKIYVAVDTGSTTSITYLRGTVGVAGAITWSVNTTFTTDATNAAQVSAMEVNSTGHPHIYYSRQNGAAGAWNRHLSWARSSDGIGTSWTKSLVDANGGDSIYYVDAAVVIKSNDDEVVFYRMASTPWAYLSTRTWDNSTLTWSAETDLETCSTAPTNDCTNQAILSAAVDSNGYTSLIYGCGATCPEVARQNKVVLLYNNGTNNFIPLDTLQNYEEVSANNYNDMWYLYWKGSATTIKSQNGTDPSHFNSIWTPYTINTPVKISGSTSSTYFGLVLTNGSSPYTVSYSKLVSPSTTTTTATVTTLTTQTTTADTIVDAVANQFAAVMENLFPALIIILVFVYLAYKAGASGEVLAYVFIITLALTSFINLMPWWITVIVSVIMIAILLNYRQRGGGVPQ